jgi:hypothetical protein
MVPEVQRISLRGDVRITIDRAGLPLEVRETTTFLMGVPGATTSVTRCDQWGQPVDVPEPTTLPGSTGIR